jgi:hypothetical protein
MTGMKIETNQAMPAFSNWGSKMQERRQWRQQARVAFLTVPADFLFSPPGQGRVGEREIKKRKTKILEA